MAKRSRSTAECSWSEVIDPLWPEHRYNPDSALLPLLLVAFYSPLPQITQWRVVEMLPRIPMPARERYRVFERLKELLDEKGSILRTCAIEGIATLGMADPELREEAAGIVRHALQHGTPAMKARSRHWIKRIEQV